MLAEGVCSVEDRLHERLPWPVPPRWRREEFAVDATDAMTGERGAKTGARSGVSCVDKPGVASFEALSRRSTLLADSGLAHALSARTDNPGRLCF